VVTQNLDDLGNLRGETLRKAWHPCENPPHGIEFAVETGPHIVYVTAHTRLAARRRTVDLHTMHATAESSPIKLHVEDEMVSLSLLEDRGFGRSYCCASNPSTPEGGMRSLHQKEHTWTA
jgi:hypothetical protein